MGLHMATRYFDLAPTTYNKEARTVDAILSSARPCRASLE